MRRIGKIEYDTKTVLGKGGFGVVFSGRFEGRGVAVKRMTLEDVNPREEDALNSLIDHPNVIKLLHTEKNEDFTYFALGLCKASMKDIFRRDDDPKKYKGPLPSDLDTMLQLSEGLAYIHDKGFVHRDVTPGNVLITYPNENGEVVFKWSDFGLSKPVSPKKTFSISTLKGTPNWIAPEILEIVQSNPDNVKKDHGTVESDTWSTGCVLFASLTKGKHPFGDSPKDITSNMEGSNPINMKVLSRDHFAFNIITGMIEKDPAKRTKLNDVVKILKDVNFLEMERELLDLCSRPSPGPMELDRIAALLQLGVNPNCTNGDGQTPLLFCLENLDGEPSIKSLKVLLGGKQSRRVKLEGIQDGGTALHWLCKNYKNENIVDAIKILVEKGVDVKLKDIGGWTALHFLCWNYRKGNIVDAMKILIEEGVDVNLTDNYGRTALHWLCCFYKNENIVDAMKILVENGVDVKLKDYYGRTALHFLCSNYKNENILDAMKILVENGVDVKLKDKRGRTALHFLCSNYKNENILDAMMLLIENGVDVEVKDDIEWRTALDYLSADSKMAACKEKFLEKLTGKGTGLNENRL